MLPPAEEQLASHLDLQALGLKGEAHLQAGNGTLHALPSEGRQRSDEDPGQEEQSDPADRASRGQDHAPRIAARVELESNSKSRGPHMSNRGPDPAVSASFTAPGVTRAEGPS